jgi:arabinogalactan oligomer/maltooligosaccharide transport system permease protein
MMVALLGGLQGIPQDQYEAARVDGASRWQSFWNITVPGLRSVSTMVILLGIIWTFNLFAVIFFTPRGGPAGKTNILVTFAYDVFNQGELALAATFGVIIFSILIVFSLIYRRLTPEQA